MGGESIDNLTAQLDSFDADKRRAALERLVQLAGSVPPQGWRPEVNLHCHTFFSYNAYGYSPSRFAWEAFRYGLDVAGIVDFDVLDGVAEFLSAGRLLALKTVAGFETRVFIREYKDKVINSPHEPGVLYLVGTGFTVPPEPGTGAARTLAAMADCARRRNLTMAGCINQYLDPVTIDYENDVLPLTPAGNATERHMLAAYEQRAREVFSDDGELAGFWSEKLSEPLENSKELLGDVTALKGLIRSRLMKHGGVGYAAPQEGRFPSLEQVVEMTLDCGAVPSGAWLDGTNEGETDPLEHFGFLRDKGIPTVTIIPDRNWNIKDAEDRALKVQSFHKALDAAAQLNIPVFVGTEMNSPGAKFVDTFSAAQMEPYRQVFLDGARFAWGHTLLKMTIGVGCTGPWADAHFDDDSVRLNAFFRRVGEMPYPNEAVIEELAAQGAEADPAALLRIMGRQRGT